MKAFFSPDRERVLWKRMIRCHREVFLRGKSRSRTRHKKEPDLSNTLSFGKVQMFTMRAIQYSKRRSISLWQGDSIKADSSIQLIYESSTA